MENEERRIEKERLGIYFDYRKFVLSTNMIYTIHKPDSINTIVDLPASKSISNRILIMNALAGNKCLIQGLSKSNDTQVLYKALSSSEQVVDIGAAGTAMRFLTAYYSATSGEKIITGTERMKNRPIRILVEALRELGADIEYLEKEGFPPLKIKGKQLSGKTISLDGSISSQYISALMMIAPLMETGLQIRLAGNVISEPYIEMTVGLMREFGIEINRKENDIEILPGKYFAESYLVENDWSAASYWYEIKALSDKDSQIELTGLSENSCQGDSQGRFLFEKIGVKTIFSEDKVLLQKPIADSEDDAILEYDFINEPDLAQTFVVTCCLLGKPFFFSGLQSLRIKETDRIAALQTELKKMGFLLDVTENTITWKGKLCIREEDPVISTYEDHRMAMAFAPACLKLGKIKIEEPQVVSKSYPKFWEDLERAGFRIQEDLRTDTEKLTSTY